MSTEDDAIRATSRRFNALLLQAHQRYMIEVRRIEDRRLIAIKNVKTCEAFAEWMVREYGKKDER